MELRDVDVCLVEAEAQRVVDSLLHHVPGETGRPVGLAQNLVRDDPVASRRGVVLDQRRL